MVTRIPYTEDPFGELSDNFQVIRACAIQSYATLEQSLCNLFGHLAGVSNQVAGIIFFKMANARSRIAVLERLKRLRHGSEYNLHFNSIMRAAGRLDTKRNQIVHWTESVFIYPGPLGKPYRKAELIPPDFWDRDDNSPALSADDILDFARECDVYARGINILTFHWSGLTQGEQLQTWLDIFEQPLAYPLREDHPLFRKRPELPTQPQSSEG